MTKVGQLTIKLDGEFTGRNKHNAPISNSRMEKEIHYVLTRQIMKVISTVNLKAVSFLFP